MLVVSRCSEPPPAELCLLRDGLRYVKRLFVRVGVVGSEAATEIDALPAAYLDVDGECVRKALSSAVDVSCNADMPNSSLRKKVLYVLLASSRCASESVPLCILRLLLVEGDDPGALPFPLFSRLNCVAKSSPSRLGINLRARHRQY